MGHNVVVLGCGRVGATMAKDLAADPALTVTAVDSREENLERLPVEPSIARRRVDVRDTKALVKAIAGADLVMGALASELAFATLRSVIEAGKNVCDVSFMSEDAMELDGLAHERGVTAVFDCGVAPGLSNLIVGHVHRLLDETERVQIYCGGLPKVRQWPYEYKAPFAPEDVIEEYTRPARIVEYGELVVKPAMSDPELIDFPQVGTLEAFNTDGLRSLIRSIPARHMVEKTLRYPGHIQLMRALRDTGFFEKIHIDVGGSRVRPIDVTAALLFPLWAFEEDEEEFTLLRVAVEGRQGQRRVCHTYELYDEFDSVNRVTAMARTTGFPAAIVGRMLLAGAFPQPGVHPPERLAAREGVLEEVSEELGRRGVALISEISDLGM